MGVPEHFLIVSIVILLAVVVMQMRLMMRVLEQRDLAQRLHHKTPSDMSAVNDH